MSSEITISAAEILLALAAAAKSAEIKQLLVWEKHWYEPDGENPDPDDLKLRLARLDAGLLAAEASVGALVEGTQSAPMRDALELTLYLVKRLRVGWNASGLWSPDALEGADSGEVESVEHELTHRLRAIERAALLRAGDVPAGDAERLALLGESLQAATVDLDY